MISPCKLGSVFQSQVCTRYKSRDVYMELSMWAPSCLLGQKLGCTIPVWIHRLLQCMHWDQHWINYTRHLEFHIKISEHPPGVLCVFQQQCGCCDSNSACWDLWLNAAFCQPHLGCFCQSEQFSCLRFLSWGDYLCVIQEVILNLEKCEGLMQVLLWPATSHLPFWGRQIFFFLN